MTADIDGRMEGIAAEEPTKPAQPTQDASNSVADSGEERAAKRLKVADSIPDAITTSTQGNLENDTKENESSKTENSNSKNADGDAEFAPATEPRKGVAPIKKEYLISVSKASAEQKDKIDDDAAEGRSEQTQNGDARDARDERGARGKKDKRDKKKNKGQNVERSFGRFDDAFRLCNSRANFPEFSPGECRFGDNCQLSHDLRKYLAEGRRGDLDTFDGKCPSFEAYGKCTAGWKCRFVKSHMREIEHEDGRKELVLIDNTAKESPRESSTNGEDKAHNAEDTNEVDDAEEGRAGVYNIIPGKVKYELSRKRVDFTKTDQYINWSNGEAKINDTFNQRRKQQSTEGIEDLRAQFVDPPFKASEKRRLYFGPETPALAPLTTQGNLPFRRLCVELGAELTYSEMAMGMPLVQGAKADWTLLKAHQSEITPPKFNPGDGTDGRKKNMVFDNYDHTRDLRFGAQISGSVPWVAIKAADILNRYCPHLRLIDLNCGCPIDMIFKSGGGSALLESGGKLERMIRGMNAVSGEIPITAKIRTGVKNNRPTAQSIIGRLAFGGREHRERLGAPGCAAITLHGRSREQRYTKKADWGFIADCATLIQSYNDQKDALTDTAAEPDPSTLPNTKDGKMYFLGNGDCYSHIDYQEHVEKARVDSVMIGRGALIKPWLFEEIEKGQYLDKSASERLTYIEKFVRYGLEAWGSDELGIGFTRRFLLEWLSFTHRYVPIGLLERLPPDLNDRPPAYQGRNDLETLMASDNYLDWIKISEMFLGPVHPTFKFQPKHKSNAYEAEG